MAPHTERLETTMALTTGNLRALALISKLAEKNAGTIPERFQAMYESSEKDAFQEELTVLYQKFFGRYNPFYKDHISGQGYFEPKNWAMPIGLQVETLGIYLTGIATDPSYLAKRLSEPVPVGFTRVAVPKLAYLQKILRIPDVYAQIGKSIEYVCGILEGKQGSRFMNFCNEELTPEHVRCNERAAAQRKQAEGVVPGDILILDVDLGNRTLGGKEKLFHTQRYNREEIGLFEILMHLSAVDVGWILALNPDRLTKFEDLSIFVTLEEYFWVQNGWENSLFYEWDRGHLGFNWALDDRLTFATGIALLPGVPGNLDLGDST